MPQQITLNRESTLEETVILVVNTSLYIVATAKYTWQKLFVLSFNLFVLQRATKHQWLTLVLMVGLPELSLHEEQVPALAEA